MNNILNKTILVTVGAAIGSAVTFVIAKKKYERIAQEEIDSVKRVYFEVYGDGDTEPETESVVEKKITEVHYDPEEDKYFDQDGEEVTQETVDSLTNPEYDDIISSEGYNGSNEDDEKTIKYYEKEEKNDMSTPYIIEPEEFNDNGYEVRFLTYYKDGVLEYDLSGELINEDDVDDLIGTENLNHIGEYEPDLLHIRNDKLKIDFEISMDYRSFSENE